MITGGRKKGALVSTSEGSLGASGNWYHLFWRHCTIFGFSSAMEGVVLSSLPGPSLRFVPTLPWFPLEERKLGESGKAWRQNTRVEEAWSQDLHLPCRGSNKAKACMVLVQAPAPCLLLWSMPELTFYLPFTLWVTQTLSHCFRNSLCFDSMVEVFPLCWGWKVGRFWYAFASVGRTSFLFLWVIFCFSHL